jgi:hypothetical protein
MREGALSGMNNPQCSDLSHDERTDDTFFLGLQTRYIVHPFSCAAGTQSASWIGQPPPPHMPPPHPVRFGHTSAVANNLKSDIEISRKDAKPQRSGEWLRVIACMHFTNNFTSFTCSVNSFSLNFQARLGGIAALRDAKSDFRNNRALPFTHALSIFSMQAEHICIFPFSFFIHHRNASRSTVHRNIRTVQSRQADC